MSANGGAIGEYGWKGLYVGLCKYDARGNIKAGFFRGIYGFKRRGVYWADFPKAVRPEKAQLQAA